MAQDRKKVIIVGKTGNGKSALGNKILGENLFMEAGGFNACTKTCHRETVRNFEVVDTPGLFDTNQNQNVARQADKILDALRLCPAPHAFLIVIKYDRFTAEEVSALDVLKITFGEQYLANAIVVVTHVGNDVTAASFSDACRESHQVNELQISCGQRVVRIDNKNVKEEHVKTLLRYINEVSQDGNACFNNDFLSCHEEVLRRFADLDKYDSMLVHEQVKQIAKEIKSIVDIEREIMKMEREKIERKKQLDKIYKYTSCAAFACLTLVGYVTRKLFFKRLLNLFKS